jgi:Aspartyl protease
MDAVTPENHRSCHAITMQRFSLLLVAGLVASTLHAQARCPGNATAIPFHMNQRQMLVSVTINQSGPYDFVLDTGTQMTVVDQALAADLHLAKTGDVNVAGMSLQGGAMFAQVGSVALGEHVSKNVSVLVYDMKSLQAAGFAIRGLLGEDFLSKFDVLIDNAHNVLCLDDTGAMRGDITQANAGSQ